MSDKTDHSPIPAAFAALGVRPSILRALAEASFNTPSEIQALLIPRALTGVDILGQARTGTGKTAAFAIPILQRATKGLSTQAIILVPTRELAVQVEAEVQRLGKHTPIRSVPVYGGQKIAAQMKFLKHKPEIIVGTPGRVIDLLDRNIIHFDNIRFVVLDEVDRMLDIGFRDDIRNILSRVKGMSRQGGDASNRRETRGHDEQTRSEESRGSDESTQIDLSRGSSSVGMATDALAGNGNVGTSDHAPASVDAPNAASDADSAHWADRAPSGGMTTTLAPAPGAQTIFVSATISSEIERLARQYMREPVEKLIAPGSDDKPTVANVEQYYFSVQPWDKYELLRQLLVRENPDLAIVFCRTKRGAEKLAKKLHADHIECREIHGNLAQNKRERVMKSFRTGKFDVLIATDLASRGIDVADISHIINYDIPEDPEVYVHRVGRTARMGAAGKAFTFVTREQGSELTRVESLINMVIQQATVEGFSARPTPSDWTPAPGEEIIPPSEPSKPIVSRFDRPYGATATPAAPVAGAVPVAPMVLPPRTLGSKIPIARRHKRRR